MKLHFRTFGKGNPVIILHGVFGSADNWLTIGKQLAEEWKIFLVDLRNHGSSPHSSDFDYDHMAADIEELIVDQNLEKASIIGHSMGGKVAMKFAVKYPDKLIKLVLVDIAPKYYAPHHQEIFTAFHSVPIKTLSSRSGADEAMKSVLTDSGVRQFLLKNLGRNEKGYFWKLNLNGIESNIENIGKGLENNERYEGPTLFIGGEKSDYITNEDHSTIETFFPNCEIITIAGAGHWVHADKPEALIKALRNFLS